jgi:hypothetical protein
MTNSSPAQAGKRVGVAQHAPAACADLQQQTVPAFVAEGVVDRLEAVEVEQQHRGAAAVAPCLQQALAQAVVEQRAVGQVGERVVVGEVQDARFGLLAFGDVGEDADVVARLSVRPLAPRPRPAPR